MESKSIPKASDMEEEKTVACLTTKVRSHIYN